MRVHSALILAAATTLLLAGCARGRGPRLAPERAASVAGARTDLSRALAARDLDAFLLHVEEGARIINGRDTLDLRALASRFYAELPSSAATRLWFAAPKLRICDRWVYETGGELGLNIDEPGRPPSHRRYLYSVAWTSDSAGTALIHTVAVVSREFAPPRIEGCRPSAKERFEPRRVGVTVLPSAGLAYSRAVSSIEGAMENRGFDTRLAAVPGYERRGELRLPAAVAAAWWRATPAVAVEAVASLASAIGATSGVDTTEGLAYGVRLEQWWAAVLGSLRVGDIYVGAGPALLREAWHVAVERAAVDTATLETTVGPHVSDAVATRDRLGLLLQGRIGVPLSARSFVEARWHILLVPGTSTPPAVGLPSLHVGTSSNTFGIFLGAGF